MTKAFTIMGIVVSFHTLEENMQKLSGVTVELLQAIAEKGEKNTAFQELLEAADFPSLLKNTQTAMKSQNPEFVVGVANQHAALFLETSELARKEDVRFYAHEPECMELLQTQTEDEEAIPPDERLYNYFAFLLGMFSIKLFCVRMKITLDSYKSRRN